MALLSAPPNPGGASACFDVERQSAGAASVQPDLCGEGCQQGHDGPGARTYLGCHATHEARLVPRARRELVRPEHVGIPRQQPPPRPRPAPRRAGHARRHQHRVLHALGAGPRPSSLRPGARRGRPRARARRRGDRAPPGARARGQPGAPRRRRTARRPEVVPGRACSSSLPSGTRRPHTSTGATWTCSPRTSSRVRSRRCSRPGRTCCVPSSSTPRCATCSTTGKRGSATSSQDCAPQSAQTWTTRASPSWSASCQSIATRSAACGRATTSVPRSATGSTVCTIRRSARSSCVRQVRDRRRRRPNPRRLPR